MMSNCDLPIDEFFSLILRSRVSHSKPQIVVIQCNRQDEFTDDMIQQLCTRFKLPSIISPIEQMRYAATRDLPETLVYAAAANDTNLVEALQDSLSQIDVMSIEDAYAIANMNIRVMLINYIPKKALEDEYWRR